MAKAKYPIEGDMYRGYERSVAERRKRLDVYDFGDCYVKDAIDTLQCEIELHGEDVYLESDCDYDGQWLNVVYKENETNPEFRKRVNADIKRVEREKINKEKAKINRAAEKGRKKELDFKEIKRLKKIYPEKF